MNRRDFLKGLGLMIGGAVVAGALPAPKETAKEDSLVAEKAAHPLYAVNAKDGVIAIQNPDGTWASLPTRIGSVDEVELVLSSRTHNHNPGGLLYSGAHKHTIEVKA